MTRSAKKIGAAFAGAVAFVVVATTIAGPGRTAPADRARNAVQELVANVGPSKTVRVGACAKVGEGAEAHVYQCDLSAPGCTRSFLFAVYHDDTYGAVTYDQAMGVLRRPCRSQSDALPSVR